MCGTKRIQWLQRGIDYYQLSNILQEYRGGGTNQVERECVRIDGSGWVLSRKGREYGSPSSDTVPGCYRNPRSAFGGSRSPWLRPCPGTDTHPDHPGGSLARDSDRARRKDLPLLPLTRFDTRRRLGKIRISLRTLEVRGTVCAPARPEGGTVTTSLGAARARRGGYRSTGTVGFE